MTFDANPEAVFVASAGGAATSGGAGMSFAFADADATANPVAEAVADAALSAGAGELLGASFLGELHATPAVVAIDATRVAVSKRAIATEWRW